MREQISDKNFDCIDNIDEDIQILVLSTALLDALIECKNGLRTINKNDIETLKIDIKYIFRLCEELEKTF